VPSSAIGASRSKATRELAVALGTRDVGCIPVRKTGGANSGRIAAQFLRCRHFLHWCFVANWRTIVAYRHSCLGRLNVWVMTRKRAAILGRRPREDGVGTRYAPIVNRGGEEAARRRLFDTVAVAFPDIVKVTYCAVEIQPSLAFGSPQYSRDFPLAEMSRTGDLHADHADSTSVLAGLSWAGAAGLVGAPKSLHASRPPETTRSASQKFRYLRRTEYVAEDLLPQGFSKISYVETLPGIPNSEKMADAKIDSA